MQEEIISLALKNALTEIHNVTDGVTCSFMFTSEGKLIAGDEGKPDRTIEKATLSLQDVFERAKTIGDVKSMEIEGTNGKIEISCVNDMYLATVMTNKADVKYVETVARVIIPTLLKILENVSPAPLKNKKKNNPILDDISEEENEEKTEEIDEPEPTPIIKPHPEMPEENPELPEPVIEPPTSQLLVDTLKGLLVRSDNVQVDADTLSEWTGLFEDKAINEVQIETFSGKIVTCKVKPINDSKLSGRGLIRIPEKTCQTLDIRKGELVKVRPVISDGGK